MLCLYLESNYEKIKTTEVIDDSNILINSDLFKVDVNEYTGSKENYIFFNVNSGRIVVQRGDKISVDKLEVELV